MKKLLLALVLLSPLALSSLAQAEEGVIRLYSAAKDFGFIFPYSGGRDVFFRGTDFVHPGDVKRIREDVHVTFKSEVTRDSQGRVLVRAREIEIL